MNIYFKTYSTLATYNALNIVEDEEISSGSTNHDLPTGGGGASIKYLQDTNFSQEVALIVLDISQALANEISVCVMLCYG